MLFELAAQIEKKQAWRKAAMMPSPTRFVSLLIIVYSEREKRDREAPVLGNCESHRTQCHKPDWKLQGLFGNFIIVQTRLSLILKINGGLRIIASR